MSLAKAFLLLPALAFALPSWAADQPLPKSSADVIWMVIGTPEGDRFAKLQGKELRVSKTLEDIDRQPPMVGVPWAVNDLKTGGVMVRWDTFRFSCPVPPQSKEAVAGVTAVEIGVRRYGERVSSSWWRNDVRVSHVWVVPDKTGNPWYYVKQKYADITDALVFPYHPPLGFKLTARHEGTPVLSPEFYMLEFEVGAKDTAYDEPVRAFRKPDPKTGYGFDPLEDSALQHVGKVAFRIVRHDGKEVHVEDYPVYEPGKITGSQLLPASFVYSPYSRQYKLQGLAIGAYTAQITLDMGPLGGVLKGEEPLSVPPKPWSKQGTK